MGEKETAEDAVAIADVGDVVDEFIGRLGAKLKPVGVVKGAPITGFEGEVTGSPKLLKLIKSMDLRLTNLEELVEFDEDNTVLLWGTVTVLKKKIEDPFIDSNDKVRLQGLLDRTEKMVEKFNLSEKFKELDAGFK